MRALFVIGSLVSVTRLAAAEVETKCYEGTETTVGGPGAGKQSVVYEQIVDAKRNAIELRHWIADNDPGSSIVFAVDGTAIAVSVGGLTGRGTIAGKPWTDYTWTLRVQKLENSVHGTLGGSTMTLAIAARYDGKDVSHTDTIATAFDCAKLAERRAALGKVHH